jgi:hypothetical protein
MKVIQIFKIPFLLLLGLLLTSTSFAGNLANNRISETLPASISGNLKFYDESQIQNQTPSDINYIVDFLDGTQSQGILTSYHSKYVDLNRDPYANVWLYYETGNDTVSIKTTLYNGPIYPGQIITISPSDFSAASHPVFNITSKKQGAINEKH